MSFGGGPGRLRVLATAPVVAELPQQAMLSLLDVVVAKTALPAEPNKGKIRHPARVCH